MQYLVTMTTHVPAGTPDDAVNDIRGREARRSRELAAQGDLLRLWRPPLRPGEWRTLGLFESDRIDHLEQVLTSMPLRVWRTDEVTPLSPHPHDPDLPDRNGSARPGGEFMTTFTLGIPEGTPGPAVADAESREADRASQLGAEGHLLRLWRLPADPGGPSALGLWRAADDAEMRAILTSLPLAPWMTAETMPLTPHPSDPAG
jgi:muconolactone delta-isomerase